MNQVRFNRLTFESTFLIYRLSTVYIFLIYELTHALICNNFHCKYRLIIKYEICNAIEKLTDPHMSVALFTVT